MRKSAKTIGSIVATVVAVALIVTLTGCGPDGPGRSGRPGDADGNNQAAESSADETGADETGAARVARGTNVDTVFAVNVTPAIRGEINDYIEVNGDVETTTSVDVYADTAGEIARLPVRLGQTVEAGALIAEVDPSRPGQNFALSPVRSPIAGTITRLPARVGAQVSPQAPIAVVSRTNELEVIVDISERFISKVRAGLPATIHLDAFPDQQFDARVTELNPVVDPLTRTLEVKLGFNRPDPRIRAGMFAEVRIITEQKDNIVKVPADVLIRRFGETFVFIAREDGTAERRIVNPGIEIDNKLEITAGLEAGELVVYQGQNLLEEDSPIRIIDTIEPLSAEDTIR
jgi:membrane fusion protein, multidrug efflux system